MLDPIIDMRGQILEVIVLIDVAFIQGKTRNRGEGGIGKDRGYANRDGFQAGYSLQIRIGAMAIDIRVIEDRRKLLARMETEQGEIGAIFMG